MSRYAPGRPHVVYFLKPLDGWFAPRRGAAVLHACCTVR